MKSKHATAHNTMLHVIAFSFCVCVQRPHCEPCGYVSEHALKGSAARKAANEHNARFAAK